MREKDEAQSFCSPEVRGKLRGQKGPRGFFAPIIKRSFLSYVESVSFLFLIHRGQKGQLFVSPLFCYLFPSEKDLSFQSGKSECTLEAALENCN